VVRITVVPSLCTKLVLKDGISEIADTGCALPATRRLVYSLCITYLLNLYPTGYEPGEPLEVPTFAARASLKRIKPKEAPPELDYYPGLDYRP
jgi:hypothetical protein